MKNVVLLLLFFCYHFYASGQENDLRLLSTSGSFFSNNDYQISWSLGELSVATLGRNNLVLTQGFQQSFDQVTSVFSLEKKQFTFKVFPNPVSQLLQLELEELPNAEMNYQLKNIYGQLFSTGTISNLRTTIEVANLSNQMYFLTLSKTSGEVISVVKIQKID